MRIQPSYFPTDIFTCYYEDKTNAPLVVTPKAEMDVIDWARQHQKSIAAAIHEFGAIVFSGFNLTKDTFREAFTAITGMPPQKYKGDTPRDEIEDNIYNSTAVAPGHTIPLHQEESYMHRKDVPQYISFFCVTPPAPGTGQTVVGDVRTATQKVREHMPEFWEKMKSSTLTYTARYLPSNSWLTNWIRWLNPSHATIEKAFGTEDRNVIRTKCKALGLECEWDGDWLVVSRKGIPATIDVDGETLLCNQIYLDKLNPELCGGDGWLGKILYWITRILLYPTQSSMQFDVKFDDVNGTEISKEDAGRLLSLIQECRVGRNWKEGDLMVLNNVTMMHGKTPHSGQREIHVAMNGSAEQFETFETFETIV